MTAGMALVLTLAFPPPTASGMGPCRQEASSAAATQDIEAYKERLAPTEYRPFRDAFWEHVDLGVLILLLVGAGAVALRRAPPRWRLGLLVFSLLYLGFFRGGCLCPVGAVADVSRAVVRPEEAGRITLLIFLAPLAAALLAGRVFCGGVCPLGAAQYLIFLGSRPRKVPAVLERILRWIPLGILVATVWLALRGGCLLVCRLDPYVTAFSFGEAWIRKVLSLAGLVFSEPGPVAAGDALAWAWLCGALVISLIVSMPFCRYACPYGVLLGLFSSCALRPPGPPASACTACRACERACPVQAVDAGGEGRPPRLNSFRCIRCGRCGEACPRT